MEQEIAEIVLLVARQRNELRVVRPSLDHGKGLQHAIVELAAHLLARLRGRDALFRLAQLDREEAADPTRRRVQDDGAERVEFVVTQPPVREELELTEHPRHADRETGDEAAATRPEDARHEDAGERPGRSERLCM